MRHGAASEKFLEKLLTPLDERNSRGYLSPLAWRYPSGPTDFGSARLLPAASFEVSIAGNSGRRSLTIWLFGSWHLKDKQVLDGAGLPA